MDNSSPKKTPTLLASILPIGFLIVLLSVNVYIFQTDTLSGSNQIVLLIASAVAGLVAMRFGYSFATLLEGILHGINSSMQAILILLLMGALAGSWMVSGIVPAMIYYGLNLLNPTIFLFASCIICGIVSLATGSSWSTVATVGIALLGIGRALGISDGMIGGAIISGAYFGDKMSPMSDTTNLAPAMAGTDLFTHIRYMTLTTVPSLVITLCIYLVLGFSIEATQNVSIAEVQTAISQKFNLNPLLFVVPAVVITLIIKKMPALPALFIGMILGALAALIFQLPVIKEVSGQTNEGWEVYYRGIFKALYGTTKITTTNSMVNELLTTRGMAGMLNTIWLVLCAMIFGGIMEVSGMLQRITTTIIGLAKSTAGLIASTVGTCVFFNFTTSDQYLAIVVPGRMFAKTYRDRGLMPENLSRTLEDSATVTSVLIPWNTCGATQASVLGVATAVYAPFCFFNIISPMMTLFFAVLNIRIAKMQEPTPATETN